MQSHVSLGRREAALATDAIRAKLDRRGRTAVIAVADAHGELIGLLRLDGAPLASISSPRARGRRAGRSRRRRDHGGA